jgi:hypothetical protein
MLGSQLIKRPPMHPFRLAPSAIQNAGAPPKPLADSVSAASHSVLGGFPLASIGKAVALPAGESPSGIEDCYASPTSYSRTEKPWSPAAEMAMGALQPHYVRLVGPGFAVTPMAIRKCYLLHRGSHLDGRHGVIGVCPLPPERTLRS